MMFSAVIELCCFVACDIVDRLMELLGTFRAILKAQLLVDGQYQAHWRIDHVGQSGQLA